MEKWQIDRNKKLHIKTKTIGNNFRINKKVIDKKRKMYLDEIEKYMKENNKKRITNDELVKIILEI